MNDVIQFNNWLTAKTSEPFVIKPYGFTGELQMLTASWPKEALSQPFLWMKTSGTTSTDRNSSRWIGHTRSSLMASAESVCQWLDVKPQENWGRVLPRSNMGGLSLDVRSQQSGFTVVEADFKWNATDFHRWLVAKEIHLVSMVPAQVFDICKSGLKAPEQLRVVLVGADRLDDSLWKKAKELGWPIVRSYGLTETASMVACEPLNDVSGKTTGQLTALSHADFQVDDQGTLLIQSTSLFSSELIIKADQVHLSKRTGDWWTTSDRANVVGRQIEVLGRVDDHVKVLGSFVNLADLDQRLKTLLAELGSTSDAAFIGLPDERLGHRLCIVVEGKCSSQIQRDLLEIWNQSHSGLERAHSVLTVPELTRNNMGKLQRNWISKQIELATTARV